jgi:membrane associated rhomboid family serine protease
MPEDTSDKLPIEILKSIGQTEPGPWYPAAYARSTGINRDSLDVPLNELRAEGLVRMTDWQPSVGQGYHVTMEGRRAIARPELFSKQKRAAPIEEHPVISHHGDVPVTRLLVAIQAGVFILGLIQAIEHGGSPNQYLTDGTGELVRTLGVSRAVLYAGAWWTLLTYALVHAGVPHLGMNLLGLLFDGRQAETMYGWWRFLILYVLAVFAGGIGAVFSSPKGITVGSSGGWCGIVMAELVWVWMDREKLSAADRQRMINNFARWVILMVAISLVPGVSWGGHLGGAIGGGIAAWLLLYVPSPRPLIRWASAIALILLPCAAGFGLWYSLRYWLQQ